MAPRAPARCPRSPSPKPNRPGRVAEAAPIRFKGKGERAIVGERALTPRLSVCAGGFDEAARRDFNAAAPAHAKPRSAAALRGWSWRRHGREGRSTRPSA